MNSSRVLPVSVERAPRPAGPGARQPEEGKIEVASTRQDRAGGNSDQAAARPAAQAARPRADRRRTSRPQARRSPSAPTGGDGLGHRRAGCRGGTGRGQTDLYPRSFGRRRITGVLPSWSGRSPPSRPPCSPGVSPGQEITPLRVVKKSGPPLRIGAKPAIVFVKRGVLPVLRGRTLVAGRRTVPFRHLEPPRHHDVIRHRRVPGHCHALVPDGALSEHGAHAADDRARRQRPAPAASSRPRWTPGSSAPSTSPLRQQRQPVRGGSVPRHRQPVRPGGRAVRPAGPRRPVGGPDRQPAEQPRQPGGTWLSTGQPRSSSRPSTRSCTTRRPHSWQRAYPVAETPGRA